MPNTGWVKTGSLAKYYESLIPYTKMSGRHNRKDPYGLWQREKHSQIYSYLEICLQDG